MPRRNLLLSCLAVFLLACFYSWLGSGPPGRWRFTHRSNRYYTRLEEACRAVADKALSGLGSNTIAGDDPSLPAILRRLHSHWMIVTSNSVLIDFGTQGKGAYAISWTRSGKLLVLSEDLQLVVYPAMQEIWHPPR